MKMEEYLQTVTEQIRCKRVHDDIKQELKEHILEQKEAYVNEGMAESDACEQAVSQMGDPVETGVSLDRIHRPQMDYKMLILIGIISALSMVLQYFISVNAGAMEAFGSHALAMVIGMVFLFAVYRIDYSILGQHSCVFAAVFLAFLVLAKWLLVSPINGSSVYVQFANIRLSLSSLIYLYVPIYGGLLYHYRGQKYKGCVKLLLWAIAPVLITLAFPSLINAAILLFILFLMFTIATLKEWFGINRLFSLISLWSVTILAPIAIVITGMWTGLLRTYQSERIRGFLANDPDMNYLGRMSSEWISKSSFWGKGSESIPLIGQTLPNYTADYVLVSFGVAYGIFSILIVLALLLLLVFKIFKVSFQQKNQLGTIVGVGCGLVFLFKISLNVLMVFNLIPGTSSSLPLFSHSGTENVCAFILLGIVLSIFRYKSILKKANGIQIKKSIAKNA